MSLMIFDSSSGSGYYKSSQKAYPPAAVKSIRHISTLIEWKFSFVRECRKNIWGLLFLILRIGIV